MDPSAAIGNKAKKWHSNFPMRNEKDAPPGFPQRPQENDSPF
jgi:hypothetical protein